MSRCSTALTLLLALTGLCVWSGDALAVAKYARVTGNWGTAGTWSTNPDCTTAGATTAPTAADAVTICPGVTVTIAANAAAQSVNVQSGGTLTQATNRTLTIGGALNVAGLFTCQNSLSVAGATTVSGMLNIASANGTKNFTGNVIVNSGGTWSETVAEAISFGGNLQNDGTLTANTGVHAFTGAAGTFSGANPIVIPSVAVAGTYTNNITLTVATALSGGGTLSNGVNATLNLGGTATITTLTATASPNTVNYNGTGAQTLKQATYHHLTLSGSGVKSSGAIALQVNGTTTVTGTATFNISSTTGTKIFVGPVAVDANCSWTNTANEPVTFRGGITHNGTTFSAGSGLQTFDSNSQVLAGASAMNFGGAVTVSGAISLTNNNSNTLTIGGTLDGTAPGSSTFVNGTNATLNYGAAAAPMATGVLTAGANPNTVNYTLAGAQTISMPSASAYHHLTLSGSGTKTMPAGAMTVGGNFALSGTATTTAAGAMTVNGNFTLGAGTTFNAGLLFAHGIKGNFSNSGTFTASTSSVTLNGTAAQTIGGTVATTFYGLTVNNAAGISLSGVNATASNLLTLQSGAVSTGAQVLVAGANCPGGIVRTGGHVAGNLQLRFPTGTPSCTFHVGDASDYRPIDTTFASVTAAGNLTGTVSQSAGEHPAIATSGLDSAADVNRYWTLSNPVGGTMAFTTYTATFNFINPGDIDAGATPAGFEIERWDSAAWNNTTLSAAGAASTAASGLPSLAAGGSSSYAVGEKKPPFVVSIILASPDPTSPATAVDWTVTFNASVTGLDASDFSLVMGGGVSGASITGVTGSGTTWTVTAGTGAGAGTLGLNLVDNDTIVNAALKPLGGTGSSNGNFTGQVYTVVYTASGFVFTSSACTHNVAVGTPGQCAQVSWSPQVAGQNLTGVYITSINTSGVPTRLHASLVRTRNIEFGLSCHNPTTHAGVQAGFAGAILPLCQANGATPATWSSTVTVSFPGGSPSSSTPYTFNYADVGSVELWMRNNAIPTETGNSGAFVVKPWGFMLAASCADATVNAANQITPGTGDPKFCRAGQNFSATATAITQAASATPNYGRETPAETVAAAWSRQLPAAGADGTLPAGSLPFAGAGGVFGPPATPFTWDEVGILKVVLSVGDSNYLGAGDVSSTAYVGRFYPDHFNVVLAPPPSCAGFVYAGRPGGTVTPGQPFTATATAMNGKALPTTTTNYDTTAGFAKNVDLTLVAGGTGIGNLYVDSTPGGVGAIPASKFVAGVGQVNYNDVSGKISYVFDSFPTTATSILVHADDAETSISPLVAGTNGTTSARSGRLRLLNAYGSELLPLRLPVRAEYFNGTTWALNAADSCTSLPGSAFGLSGGIAANTSAAAVALSGGSGSLTLAKPSPVATGSVDVAANLGITGTPADVSCNASNPPTTAANMAWLQFPWCAGRLDPNARVRFGSPKAPYIYLRERY